MPKDDTASQSEQGSKGLRPYNERLFLNLIRKAGQMSKAELTRASGLSAQSATVIVNRLVKDKLLKAGASVKGKIGQPSTPYSLHPDGAISIGVKIGRRSLEVASMSFDYAIIKRLVQRYDFPHLISIQETIDKYIQELFADMSPDQRARVVGIGIALPDKLSEWEATVGAPLGAMADWETADIAGHLEHHLDLPVVSLNDASAACLAEIAIGNSQNHQCFAYFYVGTFIGGGIAFDGKLYKGQSELAGAIASIPTSIGGTPKAAQLLEGASLHYLEEAGEAAGLMEGCFYNDSPLDHTAAAIFENWLKTATPQIAFAAVSAQAFLDPDAIVIDSSLSTELTKQLIETVQLSIDNNFDHRGLASINVTAGATGISARATGSSIAPFLSEFSLEQR